jgi:hypothetical protein
MCIKLAASKQYRFAAGAPQGNITCMPNDSPFLNDVH